MIFAPCALDGFVSILHHSSLIQIPSGVGPYSSRATNAVIDCESCFPFFFFILVPPGEWADGMAGGFIRRPHYRHGHCVVLRECSTERKSFMGRLRMLRFFSLFPSFSFWNLAGRFIPVLPPDASAWSPVSKIGTDICASGLSCDLGCFCCFIVMEGICSIRKAFRN